MLHVGDVPDGPKWRRWIDAAEKEAASAIATFEATGSHTVNSRLYKRCRDELIAHFDNKCGYCEAPVVKTAVHKPDVEHYRPASRVKEYPSGEIVADADGMPHPGYFWLAYLWTNLLPACPACNRPGNNGRLAGKWDFFPIDGIRVFRPIGDIDGLEKPTLLNPWLDDPNDHLIFDIGTGIVAGKTDRGRVTVKLLDLNREGLQTLRQEAIQLAQVALADYVCAAIRHQTQAAKLLLKVEEQTSQAQTYCAFRREVVRPWLRAISTI